MKALDIFEVTVALGLGILVVLVLARLCVYFLDRWFP